MSLPAETPAPHPREITQVLEDPTAAGPHCYFYLSMMRTIATCHISLQGEDPPTHLESVMHPLPNKQGNGRILQHPLSVPF